jgi:nickel-dependent lactate racemase
VTGPADVVVTSSGGYPLDATFYQCVKGFVSCLPAVRPRGTTIAFGGCSEGVGSTAYDSLMERYSGRWRSFLEDIKEPDYFVKDQWQFQFHSRALRKVGQDKLHFLTPGLPEETLDYLSVNGHSVNGGQVEAALQELVDAATADGATVAVLPEGPYCAPVPAD